MIPGFLSFLFCSFKGLEFKRSLVLPYILTDLPSYLPVYYIHHNNVCYHHDVFFTNHDVILLPLTSSRSFSLFRRIVTTLTSSVNLIFLPLPFVTPSRRSTSVTVPCLRFLRRPTHTPCVFRVGRHDQDLSVRGRLRRLHLVASLRPVNFRTFLQTRVRSRHPSITTQSSFHPTLY